MFETVESILLVTTFIAAGGTAAVIFIVLFANSTMRTMHKQLEKLIEQNQKILDLLQKNLENKDLHKNTK